ncbi:MAG: MFS transporter [Actinomycetales bacterium]
MAESTQPSGTESTATAGPAGGFRTFMVIWSAQLIARTGNGLTAFGLGVYIYQQTQSATAVAMVTAAAFVPSMVLAPVGGVLADRLDRRLLMIAGDVLSGIGLVALFIAVNAGIANTVLICLCVGFSSVFSSVMDPAYRATVTDLLPPAQYDKAAGMVQFASASQYLVSPVVAGLLMAVFPISVILLIDIGTMVITILAMLVVWRALRRPNTTSKPGTGFWADFREGARFLFSNRALLSLVLIATLATFCIGFLQTLLTPMMLDISNEETLGVVRSIAAVGMVVASLVIGIVGVGNHYRLAIAGSLAGAGVMVGLLGSTTSVLWITIFAFGFFCALPTMNTGVEVLARVAIPNALQGKVWGLIGLISQLGYVLAYAISGPLADRVFTPLLQPDGGWADSVGAIVGVGPSRGIGVMFIGVGIGLVLIAFTVMRSRGIRDLEIRAVQEASTTLADETVKTDATVPQPTGQHATKRPAIVQPTTEQQEG